jgi:hypothetical protein
LFDGAVEEKKWHNVGWKRLTDALFTMERFETLYQDRISVHHKKIIPIDGEMPLKRPLVPLLGKRDSPDFVFFFVRENEPFGFINPSGGVEEIDRPKKYP